MIQVVPDALEQLLLLGGALGPLKVDVGAGDDLSAFVTREVLEVDAADIAASDDADMDLTRRTVVGHDVAPLCGRKGFQSENAP